MLLIYTAVLFLLGAVTKVIGKRLAALERKHSGAAKAAEAFLHQTTLKEGNSSRPDPFQNARRMVALGQLVQKQDRLESKHEAWQTTYERFARLLSGLRGWKGKTVPYTFGVIDVVGILVLVDFLGFGDIVSPRAIVNMLASLISGSSSEI